MRTSRLVQGFRQVRWASAALACALVLAQGASLAHFAIVRHAICPVHGELIHRGSEPHHSQVVDRTHGAGSALFASDLDVDASRDDHCQVVGHRREVALPTVVTGVLPDDARGASAPVALVWAPPSEVRFRLAPKQSPPA
jgi:hypothetical protein